MVEYEPDTACGTTSRYRSQRREESKPSFAGRSALRARCLVSGRYTVKIGYEISFTRHFYKT